MVFRPFNVCTINSWFTFSSGSTFKKNVDVCRRVTERSRPAFILIYLFSFKYCIIMLLSIEPFNFITS